MDDNQYAKDIMWSNGRTMRVVHSTEVNRKEKEALRRDPDVRQNGLLFLLEINEEPVGDFDEEQEVDEDPTTNPVEPKVTEETVQFFGTVTDEPTLAQLEKLTVQELRNLAVKEELNVSDLKLKADLVGRLAAHFGVEL